MKQRSDDEAQAKASAEKAAAEAREAKARADADAEAERRAAAEQAQKEAEEARTAAEKAKAEAEQTAQEARQRAEAEKAKADALAEQQALAEQTAKAQQAAAQSEQLRPQGEKEKQELRTRLHEQLNKILFTRDSARGLIANLCDILFKTGAMNCCPAHASVWPKFEALCCIPACISKSKVIPTVLAAMNTTKSFPNSVPMPSGRRTSSRPGDLEKTQPIAMNDTAEGRQQNRRVELVLSGDAIGICENTMVQQ